MALTKSPIRIGNAVFIRTATHYHTGRIIELYRDLLVLQDASWIACTKRLSVSLATGEFDEVEKIPDGLVAINRGAIVDVFNWKHPLPVETR